MGPLPGLSEHYSSFDSTAQFPAHPLQGMRKGAQPARSHGNPTEAAATRPKPPKPAWAAPAQPRVSHGWGCCTIMTRACRAALPCQDCSALMDRVGPHDDLGM